MDSELNMFGCFVSSTMGDEKGTVFRRYIWGDKGICDKLKKLSNTNYGKDLVMILFQFYVNPIPFEVVNLSEIEPYRKKEKSIGIPIIINEENFFCKSEEDRFIFLKQSIFLKITLLDSVVKKKNLDTKIEQLKSDLQLILR